MRSFIEKMEDCKEVPELDALWQGRAFACARVESVPQPTESERQAYVTRRAELSKDGRG